MFNHSSINADRRPSGRRILAIAAGLLLAGACGPATAQRALGPLVSAPPLLGVARVALPAEFERGGVTAELKGRQALKVGDRLVTGLYGRASMQVAGQGRVQLGGDSRLLIHSAEAPDGSQGGIARLVLEQGAVRIDARTRQGLLPLDVRLNLGRLKLRVFGSEIWAELGARGENVCLLSGGIEILSADGSTERLDRPGECALFGADGQRLQVLADTGEALPRKLVRTAFADDLGARAAAELAPPSPDVLPFPQPAGSP